MEGAAATAIALIGLMFVVLVLFLIVRRMTPSRSLVPIESRIGPVYKQDPKPAEYYRPIREI